MFQANMRERNEGRVDIDDLSTSVLVDMLSFMYTGEPPVLTNAADATGLLGAAAKYEIDGLKVWARQRQWKIIYKHLLIFKLFINF
jgi:hypothetical protein